MKKSTKLLIINRFTGITFARRLGRSIANFPPVILFGILGISILLVGLDYVYGLILKMLLISPPDKYLALVERLLSIIQIVSFLTVYLLLPLSREPSEKDSILVAGPVSYGIVWLGSNSIFLALITSAITLAAFPLILAAINASSIFMAGVLSGFIAFLTASSLTVCSVALSFFVWNIVRWTGQAQFGKTFIGRLLSEIGFPLLVVYAISLPILTGDSLSGGTKAVDLLPGALASVFLKPSFVNIGTTFTWVMFPVLVALVIGWWLLNHTKELSNRAAHQFASSKFFTFGVLPFQFAVAKIKRRLRYTPALIIQIIVVFLWSALSVWIVYKRPEGIVFLLPLTVLIAPYVGIIHPLFALFDDLSCEWVFTSAPIRRLTYLYLVLISMSLLAIFITLLQVVIIALLTGQIREIPGWDLWSKCLGFSGLAFAIGGASRSLLKEATGQLFIMLSFGMLAAAVNFGFGAIAHSLPNISISYLWFSLFLLSPIFVRAWEIYLGEKV